MLPPKEADLPKDDPSVFTFSAVAGVLPGPTLPLHLAEKETPNTILVNNRIPLAVNVVFKPEQDAFYRSRFRFVVTKGESFDVVLTGLGSYEEGADVLSR